MAEQDDVVVPPCADLHTATFDELLGELQGRCSSSVFAFDRRLPNDMCVGYGPDSSSISVRWRGISSSFWGLAAMVGRYQERDMDEHVGRLIRLRCADGPADDDEDV